MTPAQFIAIGKALHGPKWQLALARDLGINPRSIGFYAGGERAVPHDRIERLRDLLHAHSKKLSGLARAIPKP